MSSLHTGVTFYEDDRNKGPFMIRIGGTSDFVVGIDTQWAGEVEICEGWCNPKALLFNTLDDALKVADQVWDIEGFHTSIETIPAKQDE
jgi:hypothetical protein